MEFMDGICEMPKQAGDDLAMRTWWPHTDDLAAAEDVAGVKNAVTAIRQALAADKRIVGLLGFSQGASLIAFVLEDMAKDADAATSLAFAVMVGGHVADLSRLHKVGMRMNQVDTLHLAGEADTLVPWQSSEALCKKFGGAFVKHRGGHAVPVSTSGGDAIVDFVAKGCCKAKKSLAPAKPAAPKLPSREAYAANDVFMEEVSGLCDVYGDNLAWDNSESSETIHKITLTDPTNDDDARIHLTLTFQPNYPEVPPTLSYTETGDSRVSHTMAWHANFKRHFSDLCAEYEGSEMGYAVLEGLKEYLHAGGDETHADHDKPADTEEEEVPEKPAEETEEERAANAKEAAERVKDFTISEEDWCTAYGKGGRWHYTIGLVGKPSAGKSTLFCAATQDATAAKCAAHPFTTIEPNTGVALCGIPCPCNQNSDNSLSGFFSKHPESRPCGAEHGHTVSGDRFASLTIRDVAGLVPGAYQGRGKGNKFLDDLNDADVLVHVVDASGLTNAEGQLREDDNTTGHEKSVLQEVYWVRLEIHQWIYTNVLRKWDTIKRRPEKLPIMFTGYHATTSMVHLAARKVGITQAQMENPGAWSLSTLHLLVAAFIRVRFPVVVALNKSDMPSAAANVAYVKANLHPNEVAVEISADTERQLIALREEGKLEYRVGGCPRGEVPPQIHAYLQSHGGSTGVTEVLSTAIAMRPTIRVFPVTDAVLSSYGGGVLQQCFHLVPGSSAADLYRHLMYDHYVEGDFVRSTVFDPAISADTIIRKDQPLPQDSIVRIMTNRKSKWQQQRKQAAAAPAASK